VGGRLYLGQSLEPGDYLLQVIATDRLAVGKRAIATQAMDFEIVR
jgi:hypothetical protein